MGDGDDLRAFAPSRQVLGAVHDRARAAAEAARLGADEELRAVAAGAAAPMPAQPSDRAEHAQVPVAAREAPRITASKVKIDPDAIAVVLPSASPTDETAIGLRPAGAAPGGRGRMTEPITHPGVGGPTPESANSDKNTIVEPGNEPRPLPSSVDEAMREAELKVAESQNREIFEREKRRRIVDEQTNQKLAKIEKGSAEHFEVLALRQKWTLPLGDDDYKLWMSRQMLEQHADALKEEVAHRRIEKAKAAARGPAIVAGILVVLAGVAALGWWVRGRGPAPVTTAAAVVETAAPAVRETATPAVTMAPTAKEPTPAVSVAASAVAAPPVVDPVAPAAPASAAPPVKPGGAPPRSNPPPGKPPGSSKDMWEREF